MHSCFFVRSVMILVVLASVTGCDRTTQYAVLTTVFTGVPPMEELYAENVEAPVIENTVMEVQYKHPLWAANLCGSCHVQAAETGFDDATVEMKQGTELEAEVISKATGNQPETAEPVAEPAVVMVSPAEPETGVEPTLPPVAALLMPADKLCISCHLDKTARRAIRERLWLHNPVALGECLSCHAAHQSDNPVHLRYPVRELCSTCHQADQLPQECLTEGEDANCLSCHNSHMGRDRFLLNRDYTETKVIAGPVPEPVSLPVTPLFQNR